MPKQCRQLFIIILLYCQPQNPLELYERWHQTWKDDLQRKAIRQGHQNVTDRQLTIMVLLEIQEGLQSLGSSLAQHQLPELTAADLQEVSFVQIIFICLISRIVKYGQ